MGYKKRSAGSGRCLRVICAGCFFCILWSCGHSSQASADTADELGERRAVLGTELYDSREEVPAPAEEFVDDAGRIYELRSWEVENVPAAGRRELVSGEILYEGVMRDADLPPEAEFQVTDEESGKTIPAALPLAEAEYMNERWADTLSFTATFHQYGADLYSLGGREIRNLENEDVSSFETELLGLIGLNPESSRVESWEWSGEPYTDGGGTLCRDAAVYGKMLVYDCRAIYRGQAELPDNERYRMTAVYELQKEESVKESQVEPSASGPEIHTADIEPPGEPEAKPGFWETLVRVVKTCLKLTVGLLMLFLLVIGFRFLMKGAEEIHRKWREMDEKEK